MIKIKIFSLLMVTACLASCFRSAPNEPSQDAGAKAPAESPQNNAVSTETKVPSNVKNTETDINFDKEAVVRLTLPDDETVLDNKRGKISPEQIGERLDEHGEGTPPDKKGVYIKCDTGVSYGKLKGIFRVMREKGYKYVWFIVSATENTDNPDRIQNAEITLKDEPVKTDKKFEVVLDENGKIKLNGAEVDSVENLPARILESFKGLKSDTAVKIGDEYVNVTGVRLNAPDSVKYGEIAKIIDAMRSGGALPVILEIGDSAN